MGGDRGDGGGTGAPDLPLVNNTVAVVWIRTRMSDGGILFFIFLFCMQQV